MDTVRTREDVERWIAGYETAWRAPGTDTLQSLFAEGARYRHSPYAEPVIGLHAISEMWEAERDGPDEVFTIETEIVTLDGDTAVVRALVLYGDPLRQEYSRPVGGRVRRLGSVHLVRRVAVLAGQAVVRTRVTLPRQLGCLTQTRIGSDSSSKQSLYFCLRGPIDLVVVGVPFLVALGHSLFPVQSVLGRGVRADTVTRRAPVARLDSVVLEAKVPISVCVAEVG